MKITRYTTFYKIELNKNIMDKELWYCRELISAMSTKDYQTDLVQPFCYTLKNGILKVPRGVGDEWLKNKLNVDGMIHEGTTFPYDTKKYFNINKSPYPEQMKVIKNSLTVLKREPQVIIDMPTGRGKTFVATAIASELGCNVMVIVKTHTLLNQWCDLDKGSFAKHTRLNPKFILPMAGTKWFYETSHNHNGPQHKVYVTTHATLRTLREDKGARFLSEWFLEHKIGCKIFDEFDTEVDNMINLDFITSIRYNIYLSATTFKNGQYDDAAFQRMIKTIPKFGKEYYTEKPNRIAYIYGYKSNPTREERGSCYNFKGNFVPDKHMAVIVNHQEYFDMLKRIIEKHAMPIYNLDKGYKIVIMVGKIDTCDIVKDWIMKTFNIHPRQIGTFHSKMHKVEKEISLSKPFIISITDSIGRGLDIEKIKMTIDMETYSGGSIFKQATGRNGRVGGEEGIYIKAIDKSFADTQRYYRKLHKFFDEEFKNYYEIDIKREE